MRVWPIDANEGRGDVFFEFWPIRHESWKIEPNKKYQLRYRMVVFDGELTAVEAEEYWQNYSEKFQAITPREQVLVLLSGVVAITFILLELSWLMFYVVLGVKSSNWLYRNNRMRLFNRLTGSVFISAGTLLSLSNRN